MRADSKHLLLFLLLLRNVLYSSLKVNALLNVDLTLALCLKALLPKILHGRTISLTRVFY